MKKIQKSDSLQIYILLALAGGGMDAYSYLCRDKVFANAQTGNMLLFGVNLAEGDIVMALRYFIPVFAFAAGIFLSDNIRKRITGKRFHWRQFSLIVEMAILAVVAFIPGSANILANTLTSLACGMQVESFRTVRGNAIATTMCIGNLRSGTYNFDKYMETGDKEFARKSFLYFGIIAAFVIGAVLESVVIKYFGLKSILFSVLLLFTSCLLMIDNHN
jgi:uncharacterized membrane protein YoaK (UPF0700 family)